MIRLVAVVLACFITLSIADQNPNPKCVPPESVDSCINFKCSCGTAVQSPNCKQVSNPYIGGNQCCDNKTLQGLQCHGNRKKRQGYNFDDHPSYKWNLPIPYFFNTTINQDSYKSTVRKALSHIQAQTCVRFTESTSEPSSEHIIFSLDNQGSCVSFVGKSQKSQSPILATAVCFTDFGQMLYLVVQTIGLWHETQRPDSSNYVTINTGNMDPSHAADFNTVPASYLSTFGLPYDYASIMHYPAKIYSNNGQFTVVTKDPLYEHTIGQRVELSFQDANLINRLYCNSICSTQLNCANGGYTDPNNCQICKCPNGFTGNLCQNYDTATSTVVTTNDCGGELTASLTDQILTSPGYNSPQYYTAYTKCTWRITAPHGGNVRIQFQDNFGIYVDPSYACMHWVEIRYQGLMNNTGPRFCGSSLPTDVISNVSQVLILFRSNFTDQGSAQQRGFKMTYKVVNAPACAYITCLNGGNCVNNVCQCTSGYTGPTCNTPVSGGTGACLPNPCRNNGTCTVVGNNFTCQCLPNMWGDVCQHASCGGCDILPGPPFDSKCILYENPARNCTRTEYMDTWSYTWYWFRGNCRQRSVTIPYPCIQGYYCCDNAVDIGYGCATSGWTDWTECDRSCGNGTQYRYNYQVQQTQYGGLVYTPIETQQQTCIQPACPPPDSSCGFWGRCFRMC